MYGVVIGVTNVAGLSLARVFPLTGVPGSMAALSLVRLDFDFVGVALAEVRLRARPPEKLSGADPFSEGPEDAALAMSAG